MTYYNQNCPQAYAAPTAGLSGYLKQMVSQWMHDNRLKFTLHRERMSLASMSDDMLKDIGIDRITADRESIRRDIPAARQDANIV